MVRNRHFLVGLLACSMLAAVGCTAPLAVVRGQSPLTTQLAPAAYGNLTTAQDAFHEHGAYTSYHSTAGFPGYDYRYGGYAAECPQGCPPAYGYCPSGYCQTCGASGHGCPQHYHSYSYSRPSDLRYPQGPGGAVVYPYYTLRGPSDFFRTK